MSNEHWLQLAIALITPVLTLTVVMVGFLYNNARMNDLRQDLTSRMASLEGTFNRRLDDQRDLLRSEVARVESALLSKFAELDGRLSRLEARIR